MLLFDSSLSPRSDSQHIAHSLIYSKFSVYSNLLSTHMGGEELPPTSHYLWFCSCYPWILCCCTWGGVVYSIPSATALCAATSMPERATEENAIVFKNVVWIGSIFCIKQALMFTNGESSDTFESTIRLAPPSCTIVEPSKWWWVWVVKVHNSIRGDERTLEGHLEGCLGAGASKGKTNGGGEQEKQFPPYWWTVRDIKDRGGSIRCWRCWWDRFQPHRFEVKIHNIQRVYGVPWMFPWNLNPFSP